MVECHPFRPTRSSRDDSDILRMESFIY